jgi:hypothetical protein
MKLSAREMIYFLEYIYFTTGNRNLSPLSNSSFIQLDKLSHNSKKKIADLLQVCSFHTKNSVVANWFDRMRLERSTLSTSGDLKKRNSIVPIVNNSAVFDAFPDD